MFGPVIHQPTVKQLLESEALSEAQTLFGEDLLDRPVTQVITTLEKQASPGSLLVNSLDVLGCLDENLIKGLSAVAVIKQDNIEAISSVGAAENGAINLTPLVNGADVALKRLIKLCTHEKISLIVVPNFGEPAQVADDVRGAFFREVKSSGARLQLSLLNAVLESGLDGLVEQVSTLLNRPVVIETPEFKVLSSKNMGATPASQQKFLTEEAAKAIKRRSFAAQERAAGQEQIFSPLSVGRRLILPIVLNDFLAAYLAVMVRPSDDTEIVNDYLQAAALAAMVEFGQRRRDGGAFSITPQSLLKDLLLGGVLSASDQERLERHYGFDLCDGLHVFAVESNATTGSANKALPEDGFASCEIEGTRVFVVPHVEKNAVSWQDEARTLLEKLKGSESKKSGFKFQLGAARMVQTIIDLPEAYLEARQALVIGSMINGDESEFVIGYGQLGIRRLLYLMIDHPELDRFYDDNLAPLEAYDTEWESELIPSLRVYLEQGANLNSAARALFIHRHTLRYRLEQMADILKVDIDSQEVLLNLQIAFLIRDMKNSIRGKGK